MRVSYTYKSFPNCLRATEYSQRREAISVYMLLLVLVLGFIAGLLYFASILLLATELTLDWPFLCFGIGAVLLWGLFALYTFAHRPLATELNLRIILDEEKAAPLPEELQKDDYAQLRKDLHKKVMAAAKPASIYFFYVLGIATAIVWDIVFIKKGYVATTIIYLLVVVALAAGLLYYRHTRKRKREIEVAELYKEIRKTMNTTEKTEETWKCSQCGSRNKLTAMFCKDCGTYK